MRKASKQAKAKIPRMAERAVRMAMAVVLALGMTPGLAFAGEGEASPAPKAQTNLQAGSADLDAAQPDDPEPTLDPAESSLSAQDNKPTGVEGYVQLIDSNGNPVTEAHTAARYTYQATNGEPYGNVKFAPAPNGMYTSNYDFYGVDDELQRYVDPVTGEEDTISVINGLYMSGWTVMIADGYESAYRALPTDWYRFIVDGRSKLWASEDYIHVVNDGNFVIDPRYSFSDMLRTEGEAYIFEEGFEDADYDGVVLEFAEGSVPAEYAGNPQATEDGKTRVLVPGTASGATAIQQGDRVRVKAAMGVLSDIISSKKPSDAVQLEEVALFRTDSDTMGQLQARIQELANDDDGYNDYDYLPSCTNFADESRRAVAWSRAEGDEAIPWHVKDASGPRIAQRDDESYFTYNGDERYELVLDDISFKDAAIGSGVYYPLVAVKMNGEKFTYVGAPLEIEASATTARRDPVITTTSVPNATLGMPFSAQLSARSGLGTTATADAGITWSIAGGALPSGLSLNPATGLISGTPSRAGDFAFTIACTEKTTPAEEGRTVTLACTMKVGAKVELGEVSYAPGTYWLDKASKVSIDVPLNVDLVAAGLSESEIAVKFVTVNPDGTRNDEDEYNWGSAVGVLPGYSIHAAVSLMSLGWGPGDFTYRENIVGVERVVVNVILHDDNGEYVLEDATGAYKFYGTDWYFDESGRYGNYVMAFKNAAGKWIAEISSESGGTTYKYYDTGEPYSPTAGEFDWQPVHLVASANTEDITLGAFVNFPKLSYENSPWPCTNAEAKVWRVNNAGNAIGDVQTVDLTLEDSQYSGAAEQKHPRALWVEPGTYRFTVQGAIQDGTGTFMWLDIADKVEGAYKVEGVSPATYEFTVGQNELADLGITYGGENYLERYIANVTFEGGFSGSYDVSWYRKDGAAYYLLGSGSQMSLLTSVEGSDDPEVYVKVTPVGETATAFYPSDYIPVENRFVNVQLQRRPSFKVTGSVACASNWNPTDDQSSNWGLLQVEKPAAPGEYESGGTQWLKANEFSLSGITPGTRITYTPPTQSICRAYTYEVPADQTGDLVLTDPITAPIAHGLISFETLDFVAADRLYDAVTGADYTHDDNPARRTFGFALNDSNTRVKAKNAAGNEVPVYVIDDKRLIIRDTEANLVEGAKYTLEVRHYDPDFYWSDFYSANDNVAATWTSEITLRSVADDLAPTGRIGAADVKATALSRGRVAIHYTNPVTNYKAALLYGTDGRLIDSASRWFAESGIFQLPFMDANEEGSGDYTFCVVDGNAFGALSGGNENVGEAAKSFDTLDKLEAAINAADMVKVSFRVEANKMKDIGINEPIQLPGTQQGSMVDTSKSAVSATSSYSNYTTITVQAALLEGADLSYTRDYDKPQLEIYTNQKQPSEGEVDWVNPKALSINGKPIALTRWNDEVWNYNLSMTSGWLRLKLPDFMGDNYKGTESFPLSCSVTIPRTDYTRTQVWAYLNVRGQRHFIGSFDETASEITLAAPEVTAQTSFTAHGFTKADADVSLYLDGMEVAAVKADEYGFYTSDISFPTGVENGDEFSLQATSSWQSEGRDMAAASEVLDVTYSTTRPSLKRFWLLWQERYDGPYKYLLIYDNGDWPAMYKSFYRPGNETGLALDRRSKFCWLAEIENSQLATNVCTVLPQSENDLVLPMTKSLSQASGWYGIPSSYTPLISSQSTLDAQADTILNTMAQGDAEGSIPATMGSALISRYLQRGDAFVTEPVALDTSPAGAYVTFDEVKRETLAPEEPYTGYANEDVDDVAEYIFAVNNWGDHLRIVEKEPNADGKLVKVDPQEAARAYVSKPAGFVDEYLAVSLPYYDSMKDLLDPETGKADLSNFNWSQEADKLAWMQVHHTTEVSAVNLGEPRTMISNVRNKYNEFLENEPYETMCPCKEANNAQGGIPIVDMAVSSGNTLESFQYYVWTEDSNGNTYFRAMHRFDVDGTNEVVYRQYELDEQRMVITEWNGQTGQKTVITYELVQQSGSTPHSGLPYETPTNTSLDDVLTMWAGICTSVQMGVDDAMAKIAEIMAKPEHGEVDDPDSAYESKFRLFAQEERHPHPELTGNYANGFEEFIMCFGGMCCYTIEDGIDWCTDVSNWYHGQVDWRKNVLKEWGWIKNWGNLSEEELKSLIMFMTVNKQGCLWTYCQSIRERPPEEATDAWAKMTEEIYREGMGKVADIINTATSNAAAGATKYNLKGPLHVASKAGQSMGKKTAQERYKQWKNNKKQRKSVNGFSPTYYRIVKNLYYTAKVAGCKDTDWNPIDDDLIFPMMASDQAREERSRDKAVGSNYPKGKLDPSGFVYEAVLSNPVQGATVTLYTRNSVGDPSRDYATFVDSEKFGYEENPQVTGEDGRYQWFVGSGYWQVRVTKDGYAPVSTGDSAEFGLDATKDLDGDGIDDATTYWMPVLPEQIDVNIPLVSKEAPKVASTEVTPEGAIVTFSKYVDVESVTPDLFALEIDGASAGIARIEPLNADVAADGSLATDGSSPKMLASRFLVAFDDEAQAKVWDAGSVSVALNDPTGKITSYAGTAIAEESRTYSEMVDTPDFSDYKVDLSGAQVVLSATTGTYSGAEQKPAVSSVTLDGKALDEGTDYTVSYASDFKDAGTHTVTVTGTGQYNGSASAQFVIAAKKITPSVTLAATSYAYDGKAKAPAVTVKDGSTTLPESAYSVSYAAGRVNVGTYQVSVTLKGNYSGTGSATFSITAKATTPNVTLAATSYAYDGKAKAPAVTVKDGSATLPASAYSVSYSAGRTDVGTYKVGVTLKGNYSGTGSATFTITPRKVTPSVTLAATSYAYDGTAKAPAVTVKDGSKTLPTSAYTVSYAAGRVNAGTYKVNVSLKGNYAGTGSAMFKITPKNVIPSIKLSKKSFAYNGKSRTPAITVKVGSAKLDSSQYAVTYINPAKKTVAAGKVKTPGAYKATVTLKGNYAGSKTATFKIVPKATKLSKVTPAKKGFTAKWKKQAKQTTGYQIQYSLKKNFKSAKTVTVKGAKKTSKKIGKLKAKKKYYVHVRTYKTVKGKKYYSSWSKAKTVKTKA